MEDKSGVAPECERPVDVVYTSLILGRVKQLVDIYNKWSTAEVGSS